MLGVVLDLWLEIADCSTDIKVGYFKIVVSGENFS